MPLEKDIQRAQHFDFKGRLCNVGSVRARTADMAVVSGLHSFEVEKVIYGLGYWTWFTALQLGWYNFWISDRSYIPRYNKQVVIGMRMTRYTKMHVPIHLPDDRRQFQEQFKWARVK
jgi:hypothetical protein